MVEEIWFDECGAVWKTAQTGVLQLQGVDPDPFSGGTTDRPTGKNVEDSSVASTEGFRDWALEGRLEVESRGRVLN
jgi:hypothetical protein